MHCVRLPVRNGGCESGVGTGAVVVGGKGCDMRNGVTVFRGGKRGSREFEGLGGGRGW